MFIMVNLVAELFGEPAGLVELSRSGEWMNRVTCLNPVASGRGARALEVLKPGLSPFEMTDLPMLIFDIPGSLTTKFLVGAVTTLSLRTTLSLI